ncbi:hypothetical protein GCM10009676_19590 [Prauserella halophila]|uniref:Uncharacterized protein n=1 Tax=Prauserella halophila TaxID=185641 RepID=A0ABP4GRM0_9PSEU
MSAAYTMIQEGHELDEIIESGGPAVPTSSAGDSDSTGESGGAEEPDLFRNGRDATGGARADDGPASGNRNRPGSARNCGPCSAAPSPSTATRPVTPEGHSPRPELPPSDDRMSTGQYDDPHVTGRNQRSERLLDRHQADR